MGSAVRAAAGPARGAGSRGLHPWLFSRRPFGAGCSSPLRLCRVRALRVAVYRLGCPVMSRLRQKSVTRHWPWALPDWKSVRVRHVPKGYTFRGFSRTLMTTEGTEGHRGRPGAAPRDLLRRQVAGRHVALRRVSGRNPCRVFVVPASYRASASAPRNVEERSQDLRALALPSVARPSVSPSVAKRGQALGGWFPAGPGSFGFSAARAGGFPIWFCQRGSARSQHDDVRG
jgi:hypothetical protein